MLTHSVTAPCPRFVRMLLIPVVLTVALLVGTTPTAAQNLPAPPQAVVDTTYVPPTGVTRNAANTAAFAAALIDAMPGDEIVLQAGVTYQGPFTLPPKSGTGWITIRSNQMAALPAGTRVGPGDASLMPTILGGGSPHVAFQTSGAAHHYRLVGLEITPTPGQYATSFIRLGTGQETTLDALPSHIIIDRCYIHGRPGEAGRRGIGLNSKHSAVIDSYISDWKDDNNDSQAIGGYNGPGPYKIENNYLEGAGENIIFGGDDPKIPNLVPSDIEIRGNHFAKPLTWQGTVWDIKNLFELKSAARVVIDGNFFENNWPESQAGTAILFSLRNQSGGAPWTVLKDIAFTNNWITNVGSGVKVTGKDDTGHVTAGTFRVLIHNNVFEDVGAFGGSGRLFEIYSGPQDLVIEHNTAFPTGAIIIPDDDVTDAKSTGFFFRYNITNYGTYGVKGSGLAAGAASLDPHFDNYVFTNNVIIGGTDAASSYPPGNTFVSGVDDVGFVDYAGGNYRLQASSQFKNAPPDGKNRGADIDAIEAALTGSGSGGGGGGGDAAAPTVTITAPANGSTVSGTVAVAASASDDVGVVGVQFKLNGVNLGAEDTSYPYGVTWDTTGLSGTQTLTAVARDASGKQTTSAVVTVTVGSGGGGLTAQPVVWTSAVGPVTINGNSLSKNSGCDGCADAGAVSQQQIAAGDGYVEFTVSNTNAERYIGLSNGNPGTSGSEIKFAFDVLRGGVAVRENGVYRTDVPLATGDVLRIAVVAGVVKYSKNGSVFYTSSIAPTYPLLVDTSLFELGSDFTNVMIAGAGGSGGSGGIQNVIWTALVGPVTVSGNSLSKNSGCDGCADAGAISQQQIAAGDGYVEFTVSNTNAERYIGLSNGNPGTSGSEIKFAFDILRGGVAARENGIYRTDVALAAGDVLRIAVVGGVVKYSKNGSVFYTSSIAPTYPLLVDTSLFELGSDLSNVMISGAQ